MTYKQEKQDYEARREALERLAVLDQGPDEGVPVKVSAIYLLSFRDNFRGYKVSDCLASGPFEANFGEYYTINNQIGDYTMYLLDKDLDPKHKIAIIERGCTAKILKGWRLVLTVNYTCTSETVRNLSSFLGLFILKDDMTLDKALLDLLRPKKDKSKSDF
ncbi:hypothetical protein ABDK69_05695 [Limosilactobacillus fermentum]|uniref:hypothetical protein n=1 Tax=Limosilactobacillus fermentum TaxID=1613 RepID=UPI003F66CF9F